MSSAGVCETKGWMLNIKRVLEFRQVRIRTAVHLQPPRRAAEESAMLRLLADYRYYRILSEVLVYVV